MAAARRIKEKLYPTVIGRTFMQIGNHSRIDSTIELRHSNFCISHTVERLHTPHVGKSGMYTMAKTRAQSFRVQEG
jgi:hypothetical protein